MQTSRLTVAGVALVAGLAALNIAFLWQAQPKAALGFSDFSAFYAAGKIIHDGGARDLYQYETQAAVQRELFPEVHLRPGPLLYYHPAYEALIFALLAIWPFPAAYGIWIAVNLGLLLACVLLLYPHVRKLPAWLRLGLFVIAIGVFPIADTLMHGQDSILLLLVFVLTFVALKRGYPGLAGGCLALGLFKFHIVLLFLLPFVFARRWRMLGGFVMTGAALIAGSVAVTGITGAGDFVRLLANVQRMPADAAALYPAMMANVRGLLASTLGYMVPSTVLLLTVGASSLALLGTAVYFKAGEDASGELLDLRFGLNLLIALLISYHLNVHDLSLAFLSAILLLHGTHNRPKRFQWQVIALASVIFATPVYLVLLPYRVVSPLCVAEIGLAVVAMKLLVARVASIRAAAAAADINN